MSNYNNQRKCLKTREEERNILEEFFNSSNFISNIKNEQGKKRKPKKLASLLLSDDTSQNGSVDNYQVITYDNSEREAKYEHEMESVSFLRNPLHDPLLEIISKIQPNGEEHDQNQTLQNILGNVIRLHNEVNDVSLSLVHRKSLHAKLTTANKHLLAAFEEMLHTCHDIYKDKIKTQADRINHLQFHSNLVESQLLTQRNQTITFKDCMDSLRLDKEKLEALLKSKETQIQILSQRIAQLEEVRVDYVKCLEEFHTLNKQEKRQKKELDVNLELEDMRLKYKQLQDEMKIEMRNLTMQTEVQQNKAQRLEMTMKAKALAASRLVHSESQTEVNDSGLWDVADGWVLPVSGTAMARNRWRQCIGFSMCKACKGQGSYIAKIANLLKATLRGEVEDIEVEDFEDSDVSAASTPVAHDTQTPNSVSSNKGKDKLKIFHHNNNNNNGSSTIAKNKNITKDGDLWRLPDDLVQFMAHVPRTALAMRTFTSNKLLGAIWTLFRLKARADAEDEVLGYPMQSLSDFLVEAYLQSFGLRSKAEIGLFLLLHSVQEHHSSYPLLKFFARAIGAIRKRKSKLHNKKKSSSSSSSSSSKQMTVIPVSVLTVYLMARERLFRPYRGRYFHAIERIKESSKELQNAQKQLQITENLMTWSTNKEPTQSASRSSTPDNIASATVTHRITNFIQHNLDDDTTISNRSSNNNLNISRNPSNNKNHNTNASAYGASNIYHETVDDAANVSIPNHIVITSHPCQFWVPVDRAIQVSRAVLSYMTDSEFSVYARLLESNVKFLTKYGNVERREVSNSEVHTEVRDYILSTDSKLRNIKERKSQLERIRRNQSFKIKSTLSNNNLILKKISHKNSGILRMSSTEEKNNSNAENDDYSLLISDNNNYPNKKYSTNINVINEEDNSLSPNSRIFRMNSNSNMSHYNENKVEKKSSLHRLDSLKQISTTTTPTTSSLQRLNSQKDYSNAISRVNSIENNKSYDSNDFSVKEEVFTKNNKNNDKKREPKNNIDNVEDENDFRNSQKMPLVINVDFVLESLVDILMTIAKSEEDQLKNYFNEGDDNGDGVLSFSEFLIIVSKVAPHLSKRKILKMFREALLICQTGDCLDPASFIKVCKQHGLVSLVNLEILKEDELLT